MAAEEPHHLRQPIIKLVEHVARERGLTAAEAVAAVSHDIAEILDDYMLGLYEGIGAGREIERERRTEQSRRASKRPRPASRRAGLLRDQALTDAARPHLKSPRPPRDVSELANLILAEWARNGLPRGIKQLPKPKTVRDHLRRLELVPSHRGARKRPGTRTHQRG